MKSIQVIRDFDDKPQRLGIKQDNDRRFADYSKALKDGDLQRCRAIRLENVEDNEMSAKFDTLERLWLADMALYVREVQIVRRERDAYKSIAEGYEKKVSQSKAPPSTTSMIRRGTKMLEQVAEARKGHTEIQVSLGFSALTR